MKQHKYAHNRFPCSILPLAQVCYTTKNLTHTKKNEYRRRRKRVRDKKKSENKRERERTSMLFDKIRERERESEFEKAKPFKDDFLNNRP